MLLLDEEMETWSEAEVIAEPIRSASEPRLLVRRGESMIIGPRNEQMMYLPGEPAISLFTGAGGMDLGLEAAGFVSLVQHEWMQAACQTLISNRPRYFRHSALIQGDICKTPTSMLLDAAGLRVGEASLVCGGPPCQGFSTASSTAQRGQYDQRNDLVWEFLRVVRQAQPKFFVMENVPGFQSFNKGEYFKKFLPAAYECYYELVYGLVECVEYGIPQFRTRFICMGTRRDIAECDGLIASLPRPTHFSQDDLNTIDRLRGQSLFPDGAADRFFQPPGVRYFPDRPILVTPGPRGKEGRNEGFMQWYEELARKEPDRLIRNKDE